MLWLTQSLRTEEDQGTEDQPAAGGEQKLLQESQVGARQHLGQLSVAPGTPKQVRETSFQSHSANTSRVPAKFQTLPWAPEKAEQTKSPVLRGLLANRRQKINTINQSTEG